MDDIISLAEKQDFSDYERELLRKQVVGEQRDLNRKGYENGKTNVVSARFIQWICSQNPDSVSNIPSSIEIIGVTINEPLNLQSVNIPFRLSLIECQISQVIDLQYASAPAIDLSGSKTGMILADGLFVSGDLRLAKGFIANAPVCLVGAYIKGDIFCSGGKFYINEEYTSDQKISGCADCRSLTISSYALVLERIHVKGSVYLCGGFMVRGGVHLGDSTIEGNLNATLARFHHAKNEEASPPVKKTGRRLACESEVLCHQFCALNGEGLRIKGNLILNKVDCQGEVRLTGAHIDGDLDAAGGFFCNWNGNAIYADRLRVRGNVFFSDEFHCKGIIRLPRAEIGSDLSFYGGRIEYCNHSRHDIYLLFCEGLKIEGTVYLKKFRSVGGYLDLCNISVKGNLECTDSTFENPSKGYALKAKGMYIAGSVYLNSLERNFTTKGAVVLTGSKLGMDLICTDGNFMSDCRIQNEDYTPCAIKADNMTVGGKVKMDGARFRADGGVNLDDTKIGSFLKFRQGTFKAPEQKQGDYTFAISGGKLQVDGSIYFDEFKAMGQVMLNDASIGRNLNCTNGQIISKGGYSLQGMQMAVAGSIYLDKKFVSQGEIKLDRAVIGGNLDCSNGQFVNYPEAGSGKGKEGDANGKCFAFRAVGVKIEGCALFKEKFQVDGIVSFQGAVVGRDFVWRDIDECHSGNVSLLLDSAKVGILDDDSNSWINIRRLQINDFQYQFLSGLDVDEMRKRREIWLSLPLDFRTQPYEHLASVLRKNGYEEEARQVLIEKNNRQAKLPIIWGMFGLKRNNIQAMKKYTQGQSPFSRLKLMLLSMFVCYGYKPSRALLIGGCFIIFGWFLFWFGFSHNIMVPLKKKDCIYQIAMVKKDLVMKTSSLKLPDSSRGLLNIRKDDRLWYSLVYSLDTFLPVINLQVADFWLPSAYSPAGNNASRKKWGTFICVYRWLHIAMGWVVTTLFLAALSGIVRK
ncbi:hypothetical protein ACLG6S_16730 [Thermodesulfobacteriota bacterium B35]